MKNALLALLLALPTLAGAQQLPDSTLAAASLPPMLAADSTLSALAEAARPADTLRTDTLTLRAAAPDTSLSALRGLSATERRRLGRDDAKRHYRPGKGVFWMGVGAGTVAPITLMPFTGVLGFVAGAGGAVAVGATKANQERLHATAPQPALLRDADYRRGYTQKAQGKRMGKAALGWGVGTVATFGTLIAVLAVLLSGFSAG
ncbi:hypothetical protein EJV47_23910 [Hymenobacter gummosus]|uniref:DUF456 domain-containing protein n=1 Tax=Hymenobacter gummosus TaxID=1776032 RepID=A0A431TWI4_9BACT|nr:hypothetical protein [Hymenobacter gummosus]RTQ45879.1 hypothetical protein EJV47_23910 [Hymenobacter gummosus]